MTVSLKYAHVERESVLRKLGHKVRLDANPGEVACTSLYLDDAEWSTLSRLPAQVLTEIDRGSGPDRGLPAGFDVAAEVTHDEAFTGAALAAATPADLAMTVGRYGVELPGEQPRHGP